MTAESNNTPRETQRTPVPGAEDDWHLPACAYLSIVDVAADAVDMVEAAYRRTGVDDDLAERKYRLAYRDSPQDMTAIAKQQFGVKCRDVTFELP